MRETFIPVVPRLAYSMTAILFPQKLQAKPRGRLAPQTGLTINGARALSRLRFRLRLRAFVAHRAQLDGPRSFAFLAPMTLGAGEPFSGPAVVTNEDFFSHAKEVLRRAGDIAKRCFRPRENGGNQSGPENAGRPRKKTCHSDSSFYNAPRILPLL